MTGRGLDDLGQPHVVGVRCGCVGERGPIGKPVVAPPSESPGVGGRIASEPVPHMSTLQVIASLKS